MTFTNGVNLDPALSSTKPNENLTVQDAMIAVAVYASQLDPHDCDDDFKKIQSLAQGHPLFDEDSERTRSRIYKFANHMGTEKIKELVNLAAASLTSKPKKIAFKWAVELSLGEEGLLGKKQNLLDDLRIRLAIDNYIADRIISEIINKSTSQ
ncbi:MAG: hypothetical protein PVG87_26945 [Desulfobacteraceae bacterium]|jgi:hypothetical protein